MKLLADANIETAIVHWLRSIDHDIIWANEIAPALTDQELLEIGKKEQRKRRRKFAFDISPV